MGGAPLSMLQLAASLDRAGYSPSIVFSHHGPIIDVARSMGLEVHVANLKSAFFYGAHIRLTIRIVLPFLIYFFPTIFETRRLIRKMNPDIVHLNTSVLIPSALAAHACKVPIIWHVREAPGDNALLSYLHIRLITSISSAIIATSRYVADSYRKCAPDAGSKINVIHNALDLSRFRLDASVRHKIRNELNIPLDCPVVLMTGNVQEVKGHFVLAEAAKDIIGRYPECRFVIVSFLAGEDYRRSFRGRIKTLLNIPLDNADRMKRYCRRFGVERNFIFTGIRNDIPELIAACDIVAFLPLKPEGFGRPLIEAMAAGKPLITTDIGPSREIAGDEAALYVPAGDAESTAASLLTLARDPELRERMGKAARRRADTLFSMEKHITTITGIYHSLVRN